MNYHLFPQTSADASGEPSLADQNIHITPDSWEKYNPGDSVRTKAVSPGSRRRRAFEFVWGDYMPGDEGPRW
jgi:hypothetical protein